MVERLRERKKRETRQAIADVATGLFARDGFDAVTVADVARAAGVAKMTVFNYFARKEDLLFDRYDDLIGLVVEAISTRPTGQSAVAAVRDLYLTLTRERHPLGSFLPTAPAFWDIVAASSALRARRREFSDELQKALAELLASERGAPAGDPTARTMAGAIVVVINTVTDEAIRRMSAGESPDAAEAAQLALINAQFALIEPAESANDR
ncbi:TetR/AcrR family transcriptional regulator [Kribbella sp. NPDC058245]|uniref:TetR/AcrR family transcriptional regulator n=1 Tax=Kribbella sp. NPDC058245 TaxID=3346399 RepID=UPI0036EADB10